jgi:hypothetical protein
LFLSKTTLSFIKIQSINCDCAYDSEEIRSYNRRRGIKSNIPVNGRNRKNKKRGGHWVLYGLFIPLYFLPSYPS